MSPIWIQRVRQRSAQAHLSPGKQLSLRERSQGGGGRLPRRVRDRPDRLKPNRSKPSFQRNVVEGRSYGGHPSAAHTGRPEQICLGIRRMPGLSLSWHPPVGGRGRSTWRIAPLPADGCRCGPSPWGIGNANPEQAGPRSAEHLQERPRPPAGGCGGEGRRVEQPTPLRCAARFDSLSWKTRTSSK